MEIKNLSPGGFASNCYLLTEKSDAVLIDPTASPLDVKRALEASGATLRAILLTHGHFDHLLTADRLRDAFGVPLYVHTADGELLDNGEKNASRPFLGSDVCATPAEHLMHGGDTLHFGEITLTVLHTPGHTKGSVTLLGEGIAFTGDTLFADGYGRTDLYGGEYTALVNSLRRLRELDGAIRIYPGHGSDAKLSQIFSLLYSS